ncbi:hypothetical protein SYNPS1DRAFT_28744 [Syncephalis pseudoplumigaleata]|uniref:Uncharacterized protein n=1 Tax=Syncephalis pseudoplumigaleata TaxID=1712513 RepID=A0A4P9Z0U7_9FUNG|nr:hypothetical protein SYNPS1DRAFT_28744 [Syncephalis pseudoplumigaleata]|eukprot:RKP25522.1 hypothetical protein SYNPS1DRAFT_28744 [Syncephalis pseudoplumigaleata]
MDLRRELGTLFSEQSAQAMAIDLAEMRLERRASVPDAILVPQKMEADSAAVERDSWLSCYPPAWPDNDEIIDDDEEALAVEYASLHREVQALQQQMAQAKTQHQYYKSIHARLGRLTGKHVQDSLVTGDIAQKLNELNDLVAKRAATTH